MAQANSSAFKRGSDPLLVPIATGTGSKYEVAATFFTPGGAGSDALSFYVVNPTKCWVRLKGSGRWTINGPIGDFSPVVDADPSQPIGINAGWLFSPGFQGVFSTQFPRYMSALAVKRQGIDPATSLVSGEPNCLEISYGVGT